MKKFVALMMTLALVLALAVPVMAATQISGSPGSAGTAGIDASYTGSTNVPTLDVTVQYTSVDSSSNKAYLVLNPYKLKIADNKPGADKSDQVIASPVEISNATTDCGIDVIIKDAKADFANVEVASKPIDDNKKANKPSAFLVIYDGGTDGTDAAPTAYDKTKHVLITKDASSAVLVTSVDKAADANTPTKGYVCIGGNLATNLDLNATEFWSDSTKVDNLTYTMMIRAKAPSQS